LAASDRVLNRLQRPVRRCRQDDPDRVAIDAERRRLAEVVPAAETD